MAAGGIVHIVDDDAAIRDALSWLLRSRGLEAIAYESAEAFLAGTAPQAAGCLVLDIRMTGMSGIALFERLQAAGFGLPVIFLTGHGDVPVAVSLLKQGATDFVEKPFNDNDLVDRIIAALQQAAAQREASAADADLAARLASLSERERQVMDLVLAGRQNKIIAADLAIAIRTVEVHRARVFEKMGVKTAVELAQRMAALPAAKV
jgi:two-component system response regulator DctR